MARGIVPATMDWPLRAKNFFYAHGGTLNREDGPFITANSLIVEFTRLQALVLPPPKQKKNPPPKKTKPPPLKLPYEQTMEESHAISFAEVAAHFR